ncbi:MAG: ATP-dependent DNA helicase RecG [Candidatus Wallbacteria bacterium]|nr:ATP-dependent DNA helicase RecG [Candidatus Wallbacteria bacterium]
MLPYTTLPELNKEIRFLKGIGPKRAGQLLQLGIENLGDLLFYRPARYIAQGDIRRICDAKAGEIVLLKLKVIGVRQMRPRGRRLLEIGASDDSGRISLIFFNRNYLAESLKTGEMITAYGKILSRKGKLQIVHPAIENIEDQGEGSGKILPVYPLSEGVNQHFVRRCITGLFDDAPEVRDMLPGHVRQRCLLTGIEESLRNLHFPETEALAEAANRRFAFEEFFYFQLGVLFNRCETGKQSSPLIRADSKKKDALVQRLSFKLTGSQKKADQEIASRMASGKPMRILLQGDVGAGKTVVALLSLLRAVDSGFQAAFLAPTEVLAEQQHANLCRDLEGLAVVGLLTGSVKGSARKKILDNLKSNQIDVLVGTHALLEEGVDFYSLGLAVIDEQHRFGVMQRLKLQKKGQNPHLLVMTATPIPRTLSLTLYGEMDVVTMDELPGGRKPVRTAIRTPEQLDRVYDFVRNEARAGHRIFVVCPLIDESEKVSLSHVEGIKRELSEACLSDLSIGLLHGRMKGVEKDTIMKKFRDGEIQVLVCTTVIEVGIDIPEATVMIILDPERFGISQLHQLRGRIGRSSLQSYCILVARDVQNPRLAAVAGTNDGFLLAEADLRLRGPGEYLGERQHGALDFRFADILRDQDLLKKARTAAADYIETDPGLALLDEEVKIFLKERFATFHERLS